MNQRSSVFIAPIPVSEQQCRANIVLVNYFKERLSSNTATFSAQLTHPSREEKITANLLHAKYPKARADYLRTLAPRHFINLSNGVEVLDRTATLLQNENELRFMRLQSSHCESQAYDKILSSLDDELLFSLSCGRACYVYDYASRNKAIGVPRSLFLGLQFVKWSLAYLWFGSDSPLCPDKVLVRGKNTVPFWKSHVLPYKVKKDTKKKLRYYLPFAYEMSVKDIRLFGVYGRVSGIDGCKSLHTKMVREWLEMSNQHPGDYGEHEYWMAQSGLVVYDPDLVREEHIEIQRNFTNNKYHDLTKLPC